MRAIKENAGRQLKWASVIVILLLMVFTAWFFTRNNFNLKHYEVKQPITQSSLDIVYGSDSASLTIFMFSSYHCVYCRKFFISTLNQLQREYIKTNKVKLVVKPIELSEDKNIINALKTVVCINKYGNYNKLHQLLITDPSVVYTNEFITVTEEFCDKDIFVAECMLGGMADNYLSENITQFKTNELTGTPTFIINNKIFKGFQSFEKLKIIIENEL